MLKYVVATVLFSLSAGSAAECVPHVAGQALPAGPLKIAKIEFVRHDIFDLTASHMLSKLINILTKRPLWRSLNSYLF